MVDSREGSATVAVANGGRDDIAQRLHVVLGEQLGPIRESLEAAGQNLAGLRHAESVAIHNLQGFVSLGAGILILTGWCDCPFWSFSHLPCLPIGQEEPESAWSVSAFLHVN